MFKSLVLACALAPTLQAAPQQGPNSPSASLAAERAAAQASKDFGWQLFDQLRGQKSLAEKNILFSPLSAWLALTMASNGASGSTLAEMQAVLGTSQGTRSEWNRRAQALSLSLTDKETEETLRLANAIWVNSDGFALNPGFKTTAQQFFSLVPDTPIAREEAFSEPKTLAAMNDWVKSSTGGMIPTILSELKPSMMAVLLNALYFQGQWQEQFERGLTRPEKFRRADGEELKVPTLRMLNSLHSYAENERYKMLSLNFRQADDNPGAGRFQLDLVVPKQRTLSISSLKRADYEKLLGARQASFLNLVQIPKFRFDFSQGLNGVLEKSGMKRAFTGAAQFEELGRALSGQPIAISEVLQKTAVEMDENGFKAAAVTAVIISETAAIEPEEGSYRTFVADQPFFFALRDTKTGALLFQGFLQRPE